MIWWKNSTEREELGEDWAGLVWEKIRAMTRPNLSIPLSPDVDGCDSSELMPACNSNFHLSSSFFFFFLHLIPELYFDYMDYSSSYWPAAITGQYRSRKSWNQEHSISDDSPRAFLCDVRCTLGSLHQMCTGKGRKFNLANDCPVLWAVHAKIRSSEGSCRG